MLNDSPQSNPEVQTTSINTSRPSRTEQYAIGKTLRKGGAYCQLSIENSLTSDF